MEIIKAMQTKETVFEKTYKDYLDQLKKISFEAAAKKLGGKIQGNTITIPLYKNDYKVSVEKIAGSLGEKPGHDICVILSKYLLLCPHETPKEKDWVSFRNFKDSGPLTTYFINDVEGAISSYFSQNLYDLKKSAIALGGYPPLLEVNCDFSIQFDALPMIPVVLLYNDMDDEFPAKSSLLFERRAEKYLDAESLAMLGRQLFIRLTKALE